MLNYAVFKDIFSKGLPYQMKVRPVFAFPLSLSSFTMSSLLFGESRFISTENTVENVVIQHSKLIRKGIKKDALHSNKTR